MLILSKALVVGTYRQKLEALARLGVDLTAVVPPSWREAGSEIRFEPAEDAGYRLFVSPLRWNGHFHLHYYPDFPRLLRETRPDLVHLDEEPYNLATYLGVRAACRLRIPSLFFTWQNLVRRYPFPFSAMEQQVYRLSARAIAGSEEAAEVLRVKGFRGPLAVISQFGVDPAVFSPGPAPGGPFRVGFFNRLIPGKAPLLALDAFASLPDDSQLCVVGDGPLRQELQWEVQVRGLQRRVTILPRVPSADMPELIRDMHAILLPSVTMPNWKEQFGRILIEAMACGVPVIGSGSGEIPRVIGDGGLIVREGDSKPLADALLRLYRDPALRRSLGDRGRTRVLAHFTNEQVARRTVEAYRATLE